MNDDFDPEQMIPGRTYRVEFDDCCAKGWFQGEYVGPVTPFREGWLFTTGQIGPADWDQWTVTEVNE